MKAAMAMMTKSEEPPEFAKLWCKWFFSCCNENKPQSACSGIGKKLPFFDFTKMATCIWVLLAMPIVLEQCLLFMALGFKCGGKPVLSSNHLLSLCNFACNFLSFFSFDICFCKLKFTKTVSKCVRTKMSTQPALIGSGRRNFHEYCVYKVYGFRFVQKKIEVLYVWA